MVIRITNPVLIDCGTGFEVAHGSDLDIEVEGGQFHRVQRLFNERDPISVNQRLGLPDSTPPEYLRELVLEVIRQKDNAQVSKEQIVKSSRLWSYVQNAANAAQVFESIVKFLDQMPEQISKLFTG